MDWNFQHVSNTLFVHKIWAAQMFNLEKQLVDQKKSTTEETR